MYKNLKKVHSITSKKNISTVYSSMCIRNGAVIGFDGSMTVCVKEDALLGINAVIHADKFLKAIGSTDAPKVYTTENFLMVKEGKFQARLPLLNIEFPIQSPKGSVHDCFGLLSALKAISGFVSQDASHKWATGCMVKNGYIYATNNVILVRYKVCEGLPEMNIPAKAVNELNKINEEPLYLIKRNGGIAFMFEDDWWLDTALLDYEWPEVDSMFSTRELPPIHPELVKAVELVSPFCASGIPKIYFSDKGVSSDNKDYNSTYEGIDLPVACFHAHTLAQVLPLMEHVDWKEFPRACPFYGKQTPTGRLEGVVIGIRI